MARHWPAAALRYRLAYNVLAILALLPIGLWMMHRPGVMWWAWEGAWSWFANGAAGLALVGVWHSAAGYDMSSFLGLRRESPALAGAGGFRISSWHRFVRHPWYSLGLVIIWTRDMNSAMLVSAIAMTLYLVVGSRWEEARLVDEFGDVYRRYRERVPALLPWPGRFLSADEARQLLATSPSRN